MKPPPPRIRRTGRRVSAEARRCYAFSVSISSSPASSWVACGRAASTNRSRASFASASFSARFAYATLIISLMRLSWFTSEAP